MLQPPIARGFTSSARVALVSAGTWISFRALDAFVTWAVFRRFPEHFEETNVYARNLDGTLNLGHFAGLSAAWFVMLALYGTLIWLALRPLDRKHGTDYGIVLAVLPSWLGSAITVEAIVHNFLFWVGWRTL